MKAALVLMDGPKWPSRAIIARHGIERLYYEARDPAVDHAFLDELRSVPTTTGKALEVGVMRDPTWNTPPLSPEELADELSADLDRLASPSRGAGLKQCAALADLEIHDAAKSLRFLRRWRDPHGANRPTRETGWTLESFQGGWVTTELATAINNDPNLVVLHQNYFGTPRMYPTAADVSRANLIDARIAGVRLRGVYDAELAALVAAHFATAGVTVSGLPAWWDGLVYNFNALPA